MTQTRRKYTPEFQGRCCADGAGDSQADCSGLLVAWGSVRGFWAPGSARTRSKEVKPKAFTRDERAELTQLRKRNAELEMHGCDVSQTINGSLR